MHMTLETLSPLHIGGGAGVLKSFEFLVQKDRMIAVSEDRLVRALAAENLLEDYIATIDKGLQRFRLGDYLRNRGFDQPNLLSNITRYSCRIADVNGVQDIRPFIRDAFQRPFIPGTAIKGVLRTAIFYCAIKRMSEDRKKRFLDDPIRRSLENFKQKNDTRRGTKEWTKKNLFSRQENEFFQNFKTSKDTKKSDPKTDLLRVLRVSDSKPLERDCAEVRQAKIFRIQASDNPKGFSIPVECIPAGITFHIDWSIDMDLLARFREQNHTKNDWIPWASLEDLVTHPFACAVEMANDVLKHESDFFLEAFGEPYPIDPGENFHLGWGGSLLLSSVSFLLPAELRIEMRNLLFTDRGDAPAPKSRKRLVDQPNSGTVPGWVKIIAKED